MTTDAPSKPQLSPGLKLLLDLGPLLLFFFANSRPQFFAPLLRPFLAEPLITGEHAGIFVATAVFIPAILAALAISYALTRHIAVMPVVTAVIVVVFGGLTLALQNETFIKMKPTLVYVLFAVTLLGMVFDSVFNLTDEGWRKLTLRWGVFFAVMAVLNEIIWRNFSTDAWVNFKVFGFLPLTMIFAAMQFPLLQKYAAPEATRRE